jgi:cytochrome c556
MKSQLKTTIKLAAALAVLTASGYALAQQAPKPENLIKWRQSVFQVVGWNTGRIKANVEGTYNKDEVVKSANTLAALSKSGFEGLFVAGTEQGKGWHDTSAKAEVFSNNKHFIELAQNFSTEAGNFATVAASGDQATVKAEFGKLTKTCKACHDDFKAKD